MAVAVLGAVGARGVRVDVVWSRSGRPWALQRRIRGCVYGAEELLI